MVLPLSQSLATLPTWRPTSIFGPGTSTTTTWQSWMRTRARIAHRILRMRAQSELGAEHEPLARPCSLPRRHVERTLRRSAESDCCSVGHAGRAEWRRPKSRGMPMNEMNLTCALVHMHPCAHVHVHVQSYMCPGVTMSILLRPSTYTQHSNSRQVHVQRGGAQHSCRERERVVVRCFDSFAREPERARAHSPNRSHSTS